MGFCILPQYDQTDNFEEKIEDLERPSHSGATSGVAPLQPSATMNQSVPIGASIIDTADLDIDVEQNPGWGLVDNIDVLSCKAEWHYYRYVSAGRNQ